MPELPEVQTLVNDLISSRIIGITITDVHVFWPRCIGSPTLGRFRRRIGGLDVLKIWRRGKYIIQDLSDGYHLFIHLRLSGRLHLVAKSEPRTKHEHVILSLNDDRELRVYDPRKFARIHLCRQTEPLLGRLGPEPLDREFTNNVLIEKLHTRRRLLKPLLLDQAFLAGLGNIYCDEALWRARLHPCRVAASLNEIEAKALHRGIRRALRVGLKNVGTKKGSGKNAFYSILPRKSNPNNTFKVFRRTGKPCARCRRPIERLLVGQRGTHICPACQRL
jgi:formamidopyrimidine-DNA glycosylase